MKKTSEQVQRDAAKALLNKWRLYTLRSSAPFLKCEAERIERLLKYDLDACELRAVVEPVDLVDEFPERDVDAYWRAGGQ